MHRQVMGKIRPEYSVCCCLDVAMNIAAVIHTFTFGHCAPHWGSAWGVAASHRLAQHFLYMVPDLIVCYRADGMEGNAPQVGKRPTQSPQAAEAKARNILHK